LSSAFFTKYICPTIAGVLAGGSGGKRRDEGIGRAAGGHHYHPVLL